MDTTRIRIATGLLALALTAPAAATVSLEGEVSLDYYVANVDAEGFEDVAAGFYVERIDNAEPAATGPLSLSGWATGAPSPSSAGTELAYLPIGSLPGRSSLHDIDDAVAADDAAPGEYYVHVLVQDERYPGSFDDARSLSPRLLWRGGLEARGPLQLTTDAWGDVVDVDFAQLRNNRLDSRYTNDIALTLYATYGFGPAADGHVLCRVTVPGLYAGDRDDAPGFRCAIDPIPDGDYTVHLEVAEVGGRGGSSTLSGPDIRIDDGAIVPADAGDTYVYVAAFGLWWLLPAALAAQFVRRRAWRTIMRIRAG